MRIEKHIQDQLAHKYAQGAKDKGKILEQLATGKRINRASDDAAGMAVAVEFDKQVRAYQNAAENIQAGMSAMNIADGGASNISDMLQRQQELAVQAANGAYNQDQRDAIDKEFQSLSQEIDRESKSTDFNGQQLLDGSGGLANGTGTVQTGDGSSDTITLSAADLTQNGLGLAGQSLSSPAAALRAMGSIDAAMKRVNDTRAADGATANRFDFALSNAQNQQVNTAQALSNIQDLDYAQGLTEKVSSDLLQNSQQAAMSQFNQISRTQLLALLQ
ncbi:MAG: flagellin [Fibrobacteres bacterium]|jgi:flagellin|nr:flagellin [Fibrobacterota bacterium]